MLEIDAQAAHPAPPVFYERQLRACIGTDNHPERLDREIRREHARMAASITDANTALTPAAAPAFPKESHRRQGARII